MLSSFSPGRRLTSCCSELCWAAKTAGLGGICDALDLLPSVMKAAMLTREVTWRERPLRSAGRAGVSKGCCLLLNGRPACSCGGTTNRAMPANQRACCKRLMPFAELREPEACK